MDPHRRLSTNAFCSADELKAYAAQRVADFEMGTGTYVQTDNVAFGYPIFDAGWRVAVVVVTRSASGINVRTKDGRVGRLAAGYSVEVEVFKRRGGRWRFVRGVVTGIS